VNILEEKTCYCGKKFIGYGDECPTCKATDRATDMAVGDNGR
jgi:Zn ribbon nucleic-acid-binding protein